MRIFILCFMMLVSLIASAGLGTMSFSYEENYPGTKHWYSFSLNEYCLNPAPLRVRTFESEKKYTDTGSLEKTSVRIIHIYARVQRGKCEAIKKTLVEERIEIPVDEKRMTHVYVTYDADIQVKSGH